MTFVSVPAISFAEETEGSSEASAGVHVLNEANNWNISKEFIMPGESFYIEPKYDIRYEKLTSGTEEVGAVITLSNVGLTLDTLTARSFNGDNSKNIRHQPVFLLLHLQWKSKKTIRYRKRPYRKEDQHSKLHCFLWERLKECRQLRHHDQFKRKLQRNR